MILRKSFIAYEANTFKIESILNDFGLYRLYKRNVLDIKLPTVQKFNIDELSKIDKQIEFFRTNQNIFFEKIKKLIK